MQNQRLIVNGVFSAQTDDDEYAFAMQARCEQALRALPDELASLPRTSVPLLPTGLLGVPALLRVGSPHTGCASDIADEVLPEFTVGLKALVDEISRAGRGVIMTMGKGGVGKTTVAAALAVALADRGHEVLLSTTDPAAHLATTLEGDALPNLTVSRIDPAKETREYTAEVMATAGAHLDEQGRALLEEDLRSPCTEEIAVFRAFARTVANGNDRFVVLDTAPTGHTILLLDSALAYHREVTRQSSQMPDYVEALLPRLRDPDFARVLIVTLPEATPVHEAKELQEDLRRADIEPFAWISNQSFQPLAVSDPILRQRKHNEIPYIRNVRESLAQRFAVIPWQKKPPTGIASLRQIVQVEDDLVGQSG